MEDITNSIKAKLWDFKHTPFMSSFFFSFLFFNKEYLMIYFTDITFIEKKRLILEAIGINFLYPICTGLFFVFVYPLFFTIFYSFTLFMLENQTKLKQKIQRKRLLSFEESFEIRREISKYKKDMEDLHIKVKEEKELLVEQEKELLSEYNSYKETHLEEIKVLEGSYNTKIKGLEAELSRTERKLLEYDKSKNKPIISDVIKKATGPLAELANKDSAMGRMVKSELEKSVNKNKTIIENLKSSERDILYVFYELQSSFTKTSFDKTLKEKYNLKQGKIDFIVKTLIEKELLQYHGTKFTLTGLGLEIVNEIFE